MAVKFMSAIWPENTGVFVVTVGKDNGINTGMTINEGKNTTSKLAGDAYDSELDVLYYVGKNGADYSFTPEEGTKVTTSVCSYEDGKMTFGAFTSDNVINGENGEVTLTGLTQGKTIVRLEKDGKVEYPGSPCLRTELQDLQSFWRKGCRYFRRKSGIRFRDRQAEYGKCSESW